MYMFYEVYTIKTKWLCYNCTINPLRHMKNIHDILHLLPFSYAKFKDKSEVDKNE